MGFRADLPRPLRDAITEPAQLGGLRGGRMASMKDVGKVIPLVSLVWFQENVLPPLPDELKQDDLQELLQDLKERKVITPDGHWKGFSSEPTDAKPLENVVFRPFEAAANEVARTAERLTKRRPTVLFKCNPDMCPVSNERNNSSKPDGYGLYEEHPSFAVYDEEPRHVYWQFVVAPGEKKKHDKPDSITDNNEKILWSMNHIMREDPRRRFVVGYTIENVNMRLWFCSRTDVFVTESFSFMEQHRDLAYFFASLMYASSAQLGYDPTMRYVSDPKLRAQNQYDIDVQVERPEGSGKFVTETYRTERILSNIGAEAVRGRGTRVWAARKLVTVPNADGTFTERVAEGEPKVLKDSWIDDSRDREAVVMAKVLKSAPPAERAILEHHMLSVQCYGDVVIDGAKDTTARLRNGHDIPTNEVFWLDQTSVVGKKTVSNLAPVGPGLEVDTPQDESMHLVLYDDKCHHRVVFNERGKSIEELTSVSAIFDVLAQTVIALQTLHQCGWIHRDISSGNILVVDNNVAKVCDMEYVKHMSDNSSHLLRTGTAYYMAIEADVQKYLFTGAIEDDSDDSDDAREKTLALEMCRHQEAVKHGDSVQPLPVDDSESIDEESEAYPFKPNPLHDVESVWWLVTRLTLYRKLALRLLTDKDAIAWATKQLQHYHRYFSNPLLRQYAVTLDGEFLQGEKLVHPLMLPVAKALKTLRKYLAKTYRKAERDIPSIDHTVADRVCNKMYVAFSKLRAVYEKEDVELEPVFIRPDKKMTLEQPEAPAAGASLGPRRLELAAKRKQGDNDKCLDYDALIAGPSTSPEDGSQCVKRRKKSSSKAARKTAGSSKIIPSLSEADGAPARAAHTGKQAPSEWDINSSGLISFTYTNPGGSVAYPVPVIVTCPTIDAISWSIFVTANVALFREAYLNSANFGNSGVDPTTCVVNELGLYYSST